MWFVDPVMYSFFEMFLSKESMEWIHEHPGWTTAILGAGFAVFYGFGYATRFFSKIGNRSGASLMAALEQQAPEKIVAICQKLRAALKDGIMDGSEEQDLSESINCAWSDVGISLSQREMASVSIELLRTSFFLQLREAGEDKRITAEEKHALRNYCKVFPNLFQARAVDEILRSTDARTAIQRGELPVIETPGILMKYKGEMCHFAVPNVELAMEQTKSLGYRGASIGTTFRAGGLPIRVGYHGGKVAQDVSVMPVDSGKLYLTSQRLIFSGSTKSTSIRIDKIIKAEVDADAKVLSIVTEGERSKNLFFHTNEADLLADGIKMIAAVN
jgi:hypothetical protein